MEPSSASPPVLHILVRGLRTRCPHCGKGRLYRGWLTLVEECSECSCEIKRREGDCWAFLYASTAVITGVFVIMMLITSVSDILIGQVLVGTAAGGLLISTLPHRKGIAIALDYVLEKRYGHS